jgi:hypothetical protein
VRSEKIRMSARPEGYRRAMMLGRALFVRAVGPLPLLAAISPALGQAVTLADLEGAAIEVRLLRQQTVLREGREHSNQFQNDLKIEIGPADRIQQTNTTTAYTARGTRKGKTTSGWWTLERPRETTSRGGGHGVWIFADGTLTFLRTFQGGALKRVFAFTGGGAGGLNCTATQTFAREQGVHGIVLESAVDNVPIVILSTKPISAMCRVTKQSEAGTQ